MKYSLLTAPDRVTRSGAATFRQQFPNPCHNSFLVTIEKSSWEAQGNSRRNHSPHFLEKSMNPTNEPVPEFTAVSTEELTQLEGGAACPPLEPVVIPVGVRRLF